MSTEVISRPAEAPSESRADHRVTFARVTRSEWIKFWTLRSSWLTLLGAVAGVIIIGQLIGYNTGKSWSGLAPEDAAPSGVLQGYFLGQLLIGVLGVLFVSGEYSTGMIRSTLAAVPTRLPVLGAKALVFSVISLVAMVPTCIVAFLGAQAFRSHYGHGVGLDGNLRVVIGTGVYLALVGLLGGAIGWIVRSTPGGISSLVALLLVVPVLLRVIPGNFVVTITKYLPSEAGRTFVSTVQDPQALTPWTGLLVVVIWVVVMTGIAAFLLKRRDG